MPWSLTYKALSLVTVITFPLGDPLVDSLTIIFLLEDPQDALTIIFLLEEPKDALAIIILPEDPQDAQSNSILLLVDLLACLLYTSPSPRD